MPKRSYTYKALNRSLGKALHTYDMIQEGDRIAVGLSGGKDSWALMWLLAERLPRIPITYSLYPIHIDMGFGGDASETIAAYTNKMGWPVRVEYTNYGVLAHSSENRENPCFLCARKRRQRLFEVADAMGCNKLALGHTKDDLIETLFMNLFYGGQLSTMMPYQSFFKGRLTIIRPLSYTDEASLARFAKQMCWPVVENPCPSATKSKRREVKALLQQLYQGNKKIKGNIFRAMRHVKAEYLLK